MSGINLTTDNANISSIIDEINENSNISLIIQQIKDSQQKVLKAFEDHNSLVNKSLEIIKQKEMLNIGATPTNQLINGERLFEKTIVRKVFVKVKDPLEEIKKIQGEYKDREFYGYLTVLVMDKIVKCLCLYESTKISTSFKEIFLKLFNQCLQFKNETDHLFFNGKSFKDDILKVRDIRWLLLEMEKYPQYFQFTEDDLNVMKENGASRDNIYLVKKFLKKDGDYEEYYPEEEGGGIKLQYHMTGGCLNGEYKEYYDNGNIIKISHYKDGKLNGECKSWWHNGNISMVTRHEDNKLHGKFLEYRYDGTLDRECEYKEGKLHGRYIEYKEDGTYLKECFYTEGKLINLRTYNTSGILTLKKSLIINDTYELTRYYEGDGKLHYKVIMVGGKWNGEYNSWWHNGNKCIETTYKDDKIHGEYTYWNEDGTLREKKYYNEGIIELNNSNFYISPTNHLHCDIKDTIAVLFYTEENFCKDFLSKFKNFSNITNHIKYAMCDIEKYPEVFELNKKAVKPFTFVPSIFIYYKGSPFVRYDGELDDKKVLEFIKEAHFKATFDGLNRDINNMINKV